MCSCAMAVENWSKSGRINLSEWHDRECDFLNGRDESNVPISKQFFINVFIVK